MKTTISVDVDGVLAIDFCRSVDALNERFGTKIRPDEIDDYRMERVWERHGCDHDAVAKHMHELWSDPEWLLGCSLMLPMVRTMRRLAGLSSDPQGPIILTAREPELREVTKRWLDEHGLPYAKIVHTHNKADWCRSNKVRYHIDDAPHHAVACQQAGIGVFLVDWPYNRSVAATGLNGVWRVENPIVIPELLWHDLNAR